MKKVLLIGYPFPLRQGGSPRLLGLAKYLAEFGWQPIILTAPLDQKPGPEYRIVETGYRNTLEFWIRFFRFNQDEDLRRQVRQRLGATGRRSWLDRLLTLGGEIVNYPDYEKGWKPFAVVKGDEIISQENIEAIISTSAPLTAHVIARELKDRRGLLWLADLRDLWSQNHNYYYSSVRKRFDRRLELKTLYAADALVTVSQPWADLLKTLHKGKIIYSIINGFDPEIINDPPATLTPNFTITYTGMVYQGKQDTTGLLKALSSLIAEGAIDEKYVEVRIYGTNEGWLAEEIKQYGLSNVARQCGQVPRGVALQKQRESQILWLLNWNDPEEKGNYPGKVFEYLAARRPILATGGTSDNVIADLLKETNAGMQVTTAEDIKNVLRELYVEFKTKGKVLYHGDETKIAKYSHREMARKFSEVLGSIK